MKPDNMPWLSPYLIVQDVEKSIEFYKSAFGFELTKAMKDDNDKITHAELKYHDAIIMIGLEGEFDGEEFKSPATTKHKQYSFLYLYVDEVDKFFDKAISLGATVINPPMDKAWGDRMCSMADIDDYRWSFGTAT